MRTSGPEGERQARSLDPKDRMRLNRFGARTFVWTTLPEHRPHAWGELARFVDSMRRDNHKLLGTARSRAVDLAGLPRMEQAPPREDGSDKVAFVRIPEGQPDAGRCWPVMMTDLWDLLRPTLQSWKQRWRLGDSWWESWAFNQAALWLSVKSPIAEGGFLSPYVNASEEMYRWIANKNKSGPLVLSVEMECDDRWGSGSMETKPTAFARLLKKARGAPLKRAIRSYLKAIEEEDRTIQIQRRHVGWFLRCTVPAEAEGSPETINNVRLSAGVSHETVERAVDRLRRFLPDPHPPR